MVPRWMDEHCPVTTVTEQCNGNSLSRSRATIDAVYNLINHPNMCFGSMTRVSIALVILVSVNAALIVASDRVLFCCSSGLLASQCLLNLAEGHLIARAIPFLVEFRS